MRRPQPKGTSKPVHRTGDVKNDFTEKQLAAIGAVALAYNDLEFTLNSLFFAATKLPDYLQIEVSTRINGQEGIIAIINKALPHSGLDAKDQKWLLESISTFGAFKKNRDTMIHARIVNAPEGIGVNVERRAKTFEVLLSADALNIFYEHVVALQKEISSASSLLTRIAALKAIAADDPNRAHIEEEIRVHETQFRTNRSHRRSLTPMPKFPKGSEVHEALTRWREAQQAALMGWHQPWPEPQRPTMMSVALHQAMAFVPLHPEGKKR